MEKSALDILWVLVASILVFSMQAGFAMVESGLTRSKNSINVAIKNLTDLGISTICFWLSGFAIMFGASYFGFIGTSLFVFHPTTIWAMIFFLFQLMFCNTSATIVSGAVAERMRFSSYIISTILLSLFIYPVFGHWAWGGFLQGSATGFLAKKGFIDFAGSTVVHSLGGWVALAILVIIGPRSGRFDSDGKVRTINGSNIPITVLGVFILWFGWFGFNGGSTLGLTNEVAVIIINTTLSASAGMIGTLAVGWPLRKKPDILLVLNGSLAGLVAITAPCFAVTEIESVLIGFVGGIVMFLSTVLLEKLRIDDAVGAIPVHLAAGIWGTIAVALFGDPAILKTGLSFIEQLKIQVFGVASCGLFAFAVSFIVLYIINKISPLRVSPEDEQAGLNKAEHGVTTEILELYSVLDLQAKTGDLSLRAPEEPFTEIGQIARLYNSVMNRLESGTVEKGEYLSILNNVSDGLILIDKEGVISPYFSSATHALFNSEEIAGKKFKDLLASRIPEQMLNVFDDFLDLAFDAKQHFRLVEKMNPLAELELSFDTGHGGFAIKYFQCIFKRVVKHSTITQLMIIIRDITRQRELSKEMEENRRKASVEMELFYKILHIEPASLKDFLSSAHVDVTEINAVLSASDFDHFERLNTIFRRIHAVKGDSDMLGLDFIAEKAHDIEALIEKASQNTNADNEVFLSLALILGEIREILKKIESLLDKWKEFQVEPEQDTRSFLPRTLTALVSRLSDRHGKQVVLDIDAFQSEYIPAGKYKPIKDILVQLVRNSVYHGIETPSERTQKEKSAEGRIAIKSSLEQGKFIIKYKDDGAGLDAVKIKETALRRNLISATSASSISDRELFSLVFRPDFSTAEAVTTTAGRGIGMSLIKSIILQLKGKIALRSRKDESLEFEICIPVESS